MSSDELNSDPRIASWFDTVDHFWRRRRVAAKDRARLRAEAEADVAQSLADGADVSELIAADPAQFAADTAAANGIRDRGLQPDRSLNARSLVATALVGATAGALLAWLFLYPTVFHYTDALAITAAQAGAIAVAVHVVAAILCTLVAVAVVRWRFRFDRTINQTALLSGIGLLLGGALSVWPTMTVAAGLGYSTSAGAILTEVLIVVACCAVGVLAARWVDLRLTRGRTLPECQSSAA